MIYSTHAFFICGRQLCAVSLEKYCQTFSPSYRLIMELSILYNTTGVISVFVRTTVDQQYVCLQVTSQYKLKQGAIKQQQSVYTPTKLFV